MTRAILVVLTLALAAGCNARKRSALTRAEAASDRGDHFGEATALRTACSADKRDQEVCRRADEVAHRFIAEATNRAAPACSVGDVEQCVGALAEARTLDPSEHGRVSALLRETAEAHHRRCRELPLNTPEDAILRTRCMEAHRKSLQLSSYEERVATERREAANALARLTEGSERRGLSLVLLSLAECIARDEQIQRLRSHAWKALLAHHSVPVVIRLREVGPPLCPSLQLPPFLRCAEDRSEPAALSAIVDFKPGVMRHSVVKVARGIEYVARFERVANPEYFEAERQLSRAKRYLAASEREARLAKADCDTADSAHSRASRCYDCDARTFRDSACNRARALEDTRDNRKGEYNSAWHHLNRTPRELEHEIRDTFRYVEHHHTWELPYELSLIIDETPQVEAGGVTHTAVEHVGFEPGGLSPSPLRAPTKGELAERAMDKVRERVRDHSLAALARASIRQASACGDPSTSPVEDWLECRARAALVAGRDPTLELASWLFDRATAARPELPPAPCDAG